MFQSFSHHAKDRHNMYATESVPSFLEEISDTIDPEIVVRDPAKVGALSADPVFTTAPPVAFVYPRSRDEVVTILAAANTFSVPVWPYSTGKNWGYCNTTDRRGSVVMILERMNRIISVDSELAYAEIEPGVTYAQLNSYLREYGYPLWTDCTGGPPSGSVLGNALDRGIGVTPSGDHFANLCGLEVVLPNGSVFRTGGFASDKDGAWHTYKWGVGPSLEGLFAQSSYGIVTKAGIWLMREPESFVTGALKITEENKLAPALDSLRELMMRGVVPDKARFSNDVALLTMITQARNENLSGKPLTKEVRAELREKHNLPHWAASFGIYGIKSHVRLMRREAKRALRRCGRLVFAGKRTGELAEKLAPRLERIGGRFGKAVRYVLRHLFNISPEVLELISDMVRIHQGIPSEHVVKRAYFRHPERTPAKDINVARDGIGLLWFVPLMPLRGSEIQSYVAACEKRFAAHRIDFYVTIIVLNARTAVPLMVIIYDRDSNESCARAKRLYDTLYEDALGRGYQQFRCSQAGWERIFADVPELKEVYQEIKDALDPNHIIAPGRYGIE